MFRSIGRLISSAVLLVLTGLMMAAARYLPNLVFPFYRDLSRKVLTAIASVTGALPFALAARLALTDEETTLAAYYNALYVEQVNALTRGRVCPVRDVYGCAE